MQTRWLRKKNLQEDLEIMRTLFNDAWANNWGFVPFTQEEFEELGRFFKYLLPEESVRIAEVDGEPAAFMVGLPNLNEAIRHCNGRIWPLGWLKLLWHIFVKHPVSARVILMGVSRRYQSSMLSAGLAYRLISELRDSGVRYGSREIELSWILEDNTAIREIIENVGGKVSKVYRIYGRDL